MNELEAYPLDEAMVESFAEIDEQEKIYRIQVPAMLSGARSALLGHFCRQHKLTGAWRLAENKREIVRLEGQSLEMAANGKQD